MGLRPKPYIFSELLKLKGVSDMKLKIKETAWLGDPGVGSELSFKTNGRIFDIEIVKEKMSF